MRLPPPGEPLLPMPSPRTAAALVLAMLGAGVAVGHSVSRADAVRSPLTIVVAPPLPPVAEPAAPPAPDVPDVPDAGAPEPAAPAPEVVAPAAPEAPASSPAPTGGGSGPTGDTTTTPAPTRPPVKHVWVVTLTGHSFEETFGAGSPAPYLAGELRAKGTLLPWFLATGTDPAASGVALLGGQKDGTGPFPATTQTLADQLTGAGRTWKAYVEGARDGLQPGDDPCARPAADQPRNPFLRFASITGAPECASSIGTPDQLAADAADSDSAPSFASVLPGPAHDGSTGLADADAWLRQTVQPILDSKAYADGGLIVITFDRGADGDTRGGGGRVGALLLSPYVEAGGTVGAPYDAFALLRSIDELFALDPLGYAKDTKLKSFGRRVYAAWSPAAG